MPSLNFGFQSKCCIHWKWQLARGSWLFCFGLCQVLKPCVGDTKSWRISSPAKIVPFFLAWPSLALLITNHPVVGQKSTHDIPWHFHNKIPTQKSYLQYLQSPPIWFMEVPKKLSLPKTSRGFVDVLPTRPNGTCRWRNSSAGSSQRILPPWEVLWTPWKALWRTWSCWLQVDRWTKQINAT